MIKDLQTLKGKVQKGISYEDFKAFLGGTDGVLVSKSRGSNTYVWEASNGSQVKGSFSTSSNQCTFFSGSEK